MNIILKKISLTNFKGIRSLKFDFAGGESTISGANGSGKTSIFDGFTWCLFGKDSEQNTKFSVATLDESGAIIGGLTHTVQVVLDVDGTEISLERTQEDKKGGASTCTYAVDGFKKLKKEFDEIVSNLCPEQLFKAITNPYYFNSLKWQDQRAFLMSLCDLTKIEVSPEFQALLDKCKASNVSLTDYQKKLATDIKALKKSVEEQNTTIKVLTEQTAELNVDWSELENQKAEAEKRLAEVEAVGSKTAELEKQKAAINLELQKEVEANKQKAYGSYYEEIKQQNALKARHETISVSMHSELNKISEYEHSIKEATDEKTALVEKFNAKQNEIISEDNFKCPTCGRPFEVDKIEEVQDDFNKKKVAALEQMNQQGVNLMKKIENTQKALAEAQEKGQKFKAELAEIEANPLFAKQIKEPIQFDSSDREVELGLKINNINLQIESAADDDRTQEIADLKAKIATLYQKLGAANIINQNNAKIAAAEKKIGELNAEILKLEKHAAEIADGQKVMTTEIEKQVNSKFTLAKFKLFEKQVNGDEVETCTSTYNGVPYADLNTAMKINIGLDIINAICAQRGVSAPIFIDNAESVNEILITKAQQIKLQVSTEKQLTLTNK